MEGMLAGLDIFKEGTERGEHIVDPEARDDIAAATEIQQRIDAAPEVPDEPDQQSVPASLPVAVPAAPDVGDLLDDTLVVEDHELRACCQKLRAALRAETVRRRNAESEVGRLTEKLKTLRGYAARQRAESQSKNT